MEMNIKSKFLVLLVISIVSIQNAYSSYNNKTPSMYCQYSIDSCQITVEAIGRLREFQFNIKRHNVRINHPDRNYHFQKLNVIQFLMQ